MATVQDSTSAAAAHPVRLERAVIGVDFSAPSLAAAGWAMEHFAPQAECVLVHALDVPQPPRFMRSVFPSRAEVVTSARAGAEARLERLRREEEWGAARIDVREGRPETVIAAAAKETGADLLIVGEHARPRGIWAAPGSTAEALVRCSPVPVLLARNPPEGAPERIMVALDDSEHARAALAWARMLAQRFGAALTAFHAFRPIYLGVARTVSGIEASQKLEGEQLAETRAWLERCLGDAGCGAGEATMRIESGDPATALVAAQRGSGVDLVVTGSRGAGGAGRMLLGSVANGVLRGASCPVLVVRIA